jgi:hypothetical protein
MEHKNLDSRELQLSRLRGIKRLIEGMENLDPKVLQNWSDSK